MDHTSTAKGSARERLTLFVVVAAAEHDLGRAVPARHDVVRHRVVLRVLGQHVVQAREAEVGERDAAVAVDKDVLRLLGRE